MRRRWAEAHEHRTKAQWITKPHAIIDNESFQITANHKSREFVARRSVHGAHQKKGTGPKKWLVKPKSGTNKAKFPSVQVTAAVIKGKIRVWNYVEVNWTAAEAVHMYTNVLAKAMKKAFPTQRGPFSVIEDNARLGTSRGLE